MIEQVVDPGSFVSWDPLPGNDYIPDDEQYAAALREARERTGRAESAVTGRAAVDGIDVAIVAVDFAFLGGSIGVDAARQMVDAVERATAERLPLLAAPASGGTRLQEGTAAFVQMVAIADAVMRHRRAGLPYLAYLRNPTTGGVFASWASLAHITAAEPGAFIGFLGPRATEALRGSALPDHVQRAENLWQHGLLDAVVAPEHLRTMAITALRIITARRPVDDRAARPPAENARSASMPAGDAWQSVGRTRRPDRPHLRALLAAAGPTVPLSGTGDGVRDSSMILMLAAFNGIGCVVIGHDARRPLMPGGLRIARRGMRLAAELGLPLVTVIDTAGAALSAAAEQDGLAGEIAHTLADLLAVDTPVVSVLLGAGAGGAALALLPADRIVAAEHAWLAPLPPEGSAAIQYRSAQRAAEVATQQGIGCPDLARLGLVDRVVAEQPDAADEPHAFLARLATAIAQELGSLAGRSGEELRRARTGRFHRIGRPSGRPPV
jgi:acetyl-CoA carboxylase carboxyl transferase subunit beta